MLISKPFAKDDLLSIKLVTGEEVITRLVDDRSDAYVINRPVTLVPTAQGTAMVPYLMTADVDSDITLDKSKVIVAALSKKELSASYIQVTTGITTINSNIVR